ncbi:hypothetical protein HMPREF9999_01465 [Alloprevotella sp. oral taxon 473 str. F0040]|nr:hypothetical protein HMPREF9999_01465 [Alloprevotella sp. oral taxon 473 str. F0040]
MRAHYSNFALFAFTTFTENPCKVLNDYTLRGIFRARISLFRQNRRKAVEKGS